MITGRRGGAPPQPDGGQLRLIDAELLRGGGAQRGVGGVVVQAEHKLETFG